MGPHPLPASEVVIDVASGTDEQNLSTVPGDWQSHAVAAAAELGLADLLAAGPLAVDDLAARAKTDSATLLPMLQVLESIGIFGQVSPGMFANTLYSECLRRNIPGSAWAFAISILTVGGYYEAWAGFRGSVDMLYGYRWWELWKRSPYAGQVYEEAEPLVTAPTTLAIAGGFDWSQFGVIADIGGGVGTQLVSILDAHPLCRGILLDRPDVIAEALTHERMETHGGNFFDGVPSGADAYVLRLVIHDCAEAEALTLLRHVRSAIEPGGRLIVMENLTPETRERTAAEYGQLLRQAGFELDQVLPAAPPLSILVAKPV